MKKKPTGRVPKKVEKQFKPVGLRKEPSIRWDQAVVLVDKGLLKPRPVEVMSITDGRGKRQRVYRVILDEVVQTELEVEHGGDARE